MSGFMFTPLRHKKELAKQEDVTNPFHNTSHFVSSQLSGSLDNIPNRQMSSSILL
jgi:hypothetical protein